MADLALRIKADFDEAARQFKELADTSDNTREKIEKFAKSFSEEHVDKFIDKQKLAGAAITAARGEVAAMTAQQAAYGREIERLIKSGLSPESEAVRRLASEQKNLKDKIKDANDVQKMQADLMKGAEKAALAAFAAIGAGIAAVAAMTQKTAEMGDQYAKTSRTVGMTAESLQELEYAAKMSGVNDLTGSLQKLNKSVGDVKNGTGKLTAALKETDPYLLAQIKNAKSNEEAFNLLMKAIKNAPDEFKKAELATAAFGKAGQQMILMAESGTEGIAALREEARKYGVISNEAAANSEAYIDAQSRLKQALSGVQTELTSKMMPVIADIMQKVADFISGIDNWDKVFKRVIITVASLTAAIIAFTTVMKIAPVIKSVTMAIKTAGSALAALRIKILAVNTAIAANPIGLIATAIAAAVGIIVGVIGYAISKQKEYTDEFDNNTAAVNDNARAHAALAMQLDQEAFEASKAFNDTNTLIGAYAELGNRIRLNQAALRNLEANGGDQSTINSYRQDIEMSINRLNLYERRLQAIAQLQGKVFLDGRIQNKPSKEDKKANEEKTLTQKLNEGILLSDKQLSGDRIKQIEAFLKQRADLEEAAGGNRIEAVNKELQRILESNILNNNEIIAATDAAEKVITNLREEEEKKRQADAEKALQERRDALKKGLNSIALTETQARNEQINEVRQFLQQRLDLERSDYVQQILYITEQKDKLLALYAEGSEERIAIERALEEELNKIYDKIINNGVKEIEQRISIISQLGDAINNFAQASINVQNTALQDRLKAFDDASKAELERKKLTEEQETEIEKMNSEERKKIKKALEAEKTEIERKQSEERQKLIDEANEKAQAAAVAQRFMANAQAVIQTYLAANKALAEFGGAPAGLPAMWATIAQGLANAAVLNSTPLPKLSAETGGRFLVPDLSPRRVDGIGMRVNPGETVDVTPRGESGGNIFNFVFKMGEQVIWEVVNKGARAGELHTLQLAGNL